MGAFGGHFWAFRVTSGPAFATQSDAVAGCVGSRALGPLRRPWRRAGSIKNPTPSAHKEPHPLYTHYYIYIYIYIYIWLRLFCCGTRFGPRPGLEHKSIPGEPATKCTQAPQSRNQPGAFVQRYLPSPPSTKRTCNSPSVTFIKPAPHQATDVKSS